MQINSSASSFGSPAASDQQDQLPITVIHEPKIPQKYMPQIVIDQAQFSTKISSLIELEIRPIQNIIYVLRESELNAQQTPLGNY
jgi:hypothetical protein